jgi:hypothetical protein
MDKFKRTSKLISQIEKTSRGIIKKALSIMNDISNEESELVDDFMCENEERYSSRSDALQDLQTASLEWIKDAEIILLELPSFVIEIDGKFEITENHDECPFLCQAWKGDMYGESEIEGLQILRADLERQLNEITTENLFQKARAL